MNLTKLERMVVSVALLTLWSITVAMCAVFGNVNPSVVTLAIGGVLIGLLTAIITRRFWPSEAQTFSMFYSSPVIAPIMLRHAHVTEQSSYWFFLVYFITIIAAASILKRIRSHARN